MSGKKKRARGNRGIPRHSGAHTKNTREGSTAFALAVAVTAAVSYLPHVPFAFPYTIRFAGVLVAGCAWIWALAVEERAGLSRWNAVHSAALAVAIVTVLSGVLSFSPSTAFTFGAETSLMGVPTWLALLLVFGLAASVRADSRLQLGMDVALVWGVVSSIWVLGQRLTGDWVSAGFGNNNYVGAVLVALAPLALVRFRATRSRWKYAYALTAASCTTAAAVSGSLAALLALVAVLALILLFAPELILHKAARALRGVGIVLLSALAVIAVWAVLALATDILPSAADDFIVDDVLGQTAFTRIEMWKISWDMFKDHPLLGVGPDGFQHASQAYLSPSRLRLEGGAGVDYRALIRDPHSLLALAAGSLGLVGMAALVWLAVVWVRRLRDVVRQEKETREWRLGLAFGVIGHLTALLFVPWTIVFGPLIPLMAGLAVGPGRRDGETSVRKTGGQLTRTAVAVVVTLVAAGLSISAIVGDALVLSVRGTSDVVNAEEVYGRVVRLQPTRPYARYEQLYAFGFLASEGLAPLSEYQVRVDAAPKEIHRSGGYAANLAQIALDEAYLSGRSDLAWEADLLEVAIQEAPHHPDVVLERAHLALLEGDLGGARDRLDAYAESVPGGTDRARLYEYYYALATGSTQASAQGEHLLQEAEASVRRLVRGWNR